jgi:hypothetical protein
LSSDKPCEAARLRAKFAGGLAFADDTGCDWAAPGAARLFNSAAEPAASALDDAGGIWADVPDNAKGLEADGSACAIPATLA